MTDANMNEYRVGALQESPVRTETKTESMVSESSDTGGKMADLALSNRSMSSSGYESLLLEKSTSSSPRSIVAAETADEKLESLLTRFENFVSRLKPWAPAVASTRVRQEYRITDLLSWFTEDLFAESHRDQLRPPREKSLESFQRFLEETVGLSVPASIILPPSQVVDLLIERKPDLDLKKLSEKLAGVPVGGDLKNGGDKETYSELTFRPESDRDDSGSAANMTKFLYDIGYKLASDFAYPVLKMEENAASDPPIPGRELETYRCPEWYCHFISTSLFQLRDHRRHPHRERGWNCALCRGFVARRLGELEEHYRETHGYTSALIKETKLPSNFCLWCDKVFKRKARLESHLRWCPMAPNEENRGGQPLLIASGNDGCDLLDAELWPKCQRTRPYWFSLPSKEQCRSEAMSPANPKTLSEIEAKAREVRSFVAMPSQHRSCDREEISRTPIVCNAPLKINQAQARSEPKEESLPHQSLLWSEKTAVDVKNGKESAKMDFTSQMDQAIKPVALESVAQIPFALENSPRKDEIRRLINLARKKAESPTNKVGSESSKLDLPAVGQKPLVKMSSLVPKASPSKRCQQDIDDSIEAVVKRQRLSVESEKESVKKGDEVRNIGPASALIKTSGTFTPPADRNDAILSMGTTKKTTTVIATKKDAKIKPALVITTSNDAVLSMGTTKTINKEDTKIKPALVITTSNREIRNDAVLSIGATKTINKAGTKIKPALLITTSNGEIKSVLIKKSNEGTAQPVVKNQNQEMKKQATAQPVVVKKQNQGTMEAEMKKQAIEGIPAAPKVAGGNEAVTPVEIRNPRPPITRSSAQKSSRQQSLQKWLTPRSSIDSKAVDTSKLVRNRSDASFPYSCDQCNLKFLTYAAVEKHSVHRHLMPVSVSLCRVDTYGPCVDKPASEGITAAERVQNEIDMKKPMEKGKKLLDSTGKNIDSANSNEKHRLGTHRSGLALEKDCFVVLD